MMRMSLNRCLCAIVILTLMAVAVRSAHGQDGNSQPTLQPTADTGPDQYIELLRKDVRLLKKQIIAANLDLTDKESEKFWPIYNQYAAELTRINDAKAALIKDYVQNYTSMTDEQAEAYIKGRVAADESVYQLRLKYFPIFRRVLSGKMTATFFQIEWRVSTMIDLQVASEMPLIQP